MESVNLRNLEQIQEGEPRRVGGLGTLALLAAGAGAIGVALFLSARTGGEAKKSEVDPLAELVTEARARPQVPAEKLEGQQLEFPGLLSDRPDPTTALAAVKDERGKLVPAAGSEAPVGVAPPPLDRLPVVPLPAGHLLDSTSVTSAPRDGLARAASGAAEPPPTGDLAPPGSEGGYQIQVASFKKQEEADAFVEALRRRGHRAHRQAAYVADRGLWHRVRVGPFRSRFEADQYRSRFEKSERMAPFVVDPHKQAQQEELRKAKLAARIRKYGRE